MLKNSRAAYGGIAIGLHWISAVGVITMYVLGEKIEHAKEDGAAREVILSAIRLHQSIGVLFLFFLAAFVVQYFLQKRPSEYEQHPYLVLLSKWVKRLWILMICCQILTGPFLAWTGGRPLRVFDWFVLESPIERIGWLHEGLETIHAYAPNLFWPLIVLHVVGALKHLVIDKDGTVKRMIWPQKEA